MKQLTQTIVDYILQHTSDEGSIRFILPSYSAQVLLKVGADLEERLFARHGAAVPFVYGIAYRLGKTWQESPDLAEQTRFAHAQQRGWYNETDNLTSLRNTQRDPSRYRTLVMVLAGYDHIDDQASLQDFFRLDEQAIWEQCLNRSLLPWVENTFAPVLDKNEQAPMLGRMAGELEELRAYGLADLAGISAFLGTLDLGNVDTGPEAHRLFLNSLEAFGLPPLGSVSKSHNRKTLASYVNAAQAFSNYTAFLDASARRKALGAIHQYRNRENPAEPEDGWLGSFSSEDDLLTALECYINTRSEPDRAQLLRVDFAYLSDTILGYRGSKVSPPRKSAAKLQGLPPEVFMRAIWQALGSYATETKSNMEGRLVVELAATSFRHDFDAGGDDDAPSERQRAEAFLQVALGGLDDWLEQNLAITLDGEEARFSVRASLCPQPGKLRLTKSFRSEPQFGFRVTVHEEGKRRWTREFIWRLPQYHATRLLHDLGGWVQEYYEHGGNALPAFAAPYLPQVDAAKDEDEVRRILSIAISNPSRDVVDLLAVTSAAADIPALGLMHTMSSVYQAFWHTAMQDGFFAALRGPYDDLRQAYAAACEAVLADNTSSQLCPLLLKAFGLFEVDALHFTDWAWQGYSRFMVITPMHPALLDMLRHQYTFLAESFVFKVEAALAGPKARRFETKTWGRIVDLAGISRPVFGILRDQAGTLDCEQRGYGYVHLLGHSRTDDSGFSSQLLLDYDSEDGEIAEAELFRETRASELVSRVLNDYQQLHDHATDGLSIAAYCGHEIQPIIAGLDRFLHQTLSARNTGDFGLQLIILSDSKDDVASSRWLDAWRDSWQEANLSSSSKTHYRHCTISIACRVVTEDANHDSLSRLLQNIHVDLCFLTDFVNTGTDRFASLPPGTTPEHGYRQFPILEKSCCAVIGGGYSHLRERVLSHERFRLASLHAQVMAAVRAAACGVNQGILVISNRDFAPWRGVVNAAHTASRWVVCIDPSIDERLLCEPAQGAGRTRDIIGFGAGVGVHGESNFTISTEKCALKDVQRRIAEQLLRLGQEDHTANEQIAASLVQESAGIAGLSVVKATGPSEYVRDYIAYTVVKKLLPKDPTALVDEIISLDGFQHWFDDAPVKQRPDLLRIRARVVEGYVEVQAQIIECKVAQASDSHLAEAREQVAAGLTHLSQCFVARPQDVPVGLGDPPDRRYWWMQLHRLVATRGSVPIPHQNEALIALERLSEGLFNISWQGAVFCLWTDSESDQLWQEAEWELEAAGQALLTPALTSGLGLLRKVCLEGYTQDLFAGSGPTEQPFRHAETLVDSGPEPVRPEPQASESVTPEPAAPEPIAYEPATPQPPLDTTPGDLSLPVGGNAKRVLLGHTTATMAREVYWEVGHSELPNRHLLIFGASGTGKTYAIQALLWELAKEGQNSLIVDYTSGFLPNQLEPLVNEWLHPKQHIVRSEPLPVNPFRQQVEEIAGLELPENPGTTAQRVVGVFAEVYALGDQQKSALYTAIREGLLADAHDFGLDTLVERLADQAEAGGPTGSSAATVLSRLRPFIDMSPFGLEEPTAWESFYTDAVARCHILQLAGFSRDMARLITEFTLIDFYRFYRAHGSKERPRVVVLDEIQNMDHASDSPLAQLLTEGRKFGVSLIMATQTLSSLDNESVDRLFQASQKLFFKPADTELKSFAQILENATGEKRDEWITRLSMLGRGECYALGPARSQRGDALEPKYFKIKIAPLHTR